MPKTSAFLIGIILSLQTLSTCVVSTIGQYIYAYYLSIYSNTTLTLTLIHEETDRCLESNHSLNSNAQTWAQEKSADLFFWTNLISCCPMIVMTYLLGLYTPKLGERFVLILTMIGTFGQFVIWLAIIYFNLPEYWWYIAAIVVGLSGSTSVFNFVLTLIITESTREEDLSSRLVRLGAVQTAISAIGTFAIGYYISWRAFTDLYWMGLALQFLSIIIVIFGFESTDSTAGERTLLSSSSDSEQISSQTCCSHFFEVCTVFNPKRRSTKKSTTIFLTLISNAFYTLASSTYAPFLWFLLNAPFCWTSQNIGNYSALASISYAILSVLGMQTLTAAGATDAIICFISHIFFFASSLWIAFARYDWELYAGLSVSAFSGYQGSLTMSMVSKCLDVHERSNAFAFVTETNTIITAFGTTFFNWVYARTVDHYRNFTVLLCTGFCIIPTILNLCLFLITRKMSDEELPPLSETDIEPAPLRLPITLPPHAGDAACIVIPSRSLTSSLRTPVRSRANSDANEILI